MVATLHSVSLCVDYNQNVTPELKFDTSLCIHTRIIIYKTWTLENLSHNCSMRLVS